MTEDLPIAIVLAAGTASRFGAAKQLVEYSGETLVKRAVRAAEAVCGARSVLVTGSDWQNVAEACGRIRGFMIVNDDYADGIGTSISAGIGSVAEVASAALLMLADQPLVTPAHLGRLIDAWRKSPQSIVASAYSGTVGPPVIFPRAWFADLMSLSGDCGAKSLLEQNRENVLSIRFEPAAVDIDRPRDLEGR